MLEEPTTESARGDLSRRLAELEAQVARRRGVVDTLAALAPLISGVLIAGVGTVATVLYNERQLQLTQLAALDKYRGYLASDDPQERIFGYEAFIALGQEGFVAKLIGAKRDVAAKEILRNLAEDSEDEHTRRQASKSLKALGSLSARYESSGNPAAIGRDRARDWTYGTYQLSTRTGALAKFLSLLREEYAELASVLDAAGGEEGARLGTKEFHAAWRELADHDDFAQAQRRYIEISYFAPAADALLEEARFDIRARSSALQNVLWSLAVQHGPPGAVALMQEAAGGTKMAIMKDEMLIDAIYDERSKVNKYFRFSSPSTKAAVLRRYANEREEALKHLRAEETKN